MFKVSIDILDVAPVSNKSSKPLCNGSDQLPGVRQRKAGDLDSVPELKVLVELSILVGGDWNMICFPSIGNVIIPIDEVIFSEG